MNGAKKTPGRCRAVEISPIRSGLNVKMRAISAPVAEKMVRCLCIELHNPAEAGCDDRVEVKVSNAVSRISTLKPACLYASSDLLCLALRIKKPSSS
jgi:hypothetical protein